MKRSIVASAVIAQVAALGVLPRPALAGSPYYPDTYGAAPSRDTTRVDPNPDNIPNVKNLQGCVPLCERDLNPCDPPSYKRDDGRCDF